MKRIPLVLIALALIGGCTRLSGYKASSRYACQAPEGVACDSISGVYANAVQKRLPSQQTASVSAPPLAAPALTTPQTWVTPPLQPLRSSARVLRLWIKPWEDREGDLHDQSFVYVRVDDGRWLIEHAQQQVRDAYAPLRPPLPTATPSNAPDRPSIPQPPSFEPLLEPLSTPQEPLP